MASSSARCQRNIVLGLVLVFLVLLTPYVAFADNGLKIQVDSSNGATIYIRDDTSNPGGAYVEITGFTSPYTYPAAVAGHQYSVYVKRDGHRLLVKNKPKDWSVDTGTGTVATGTWDGGSEAVHFSGPGTGNIIVKKETDPDGSSESFTFTPSYGSNFNLSDGGSNDSGELGSGTYTVSESVQNGWALTNIVDTDPDGGTTSSGNEATIDLDGGETITVTFSNTKNASLTVIKEVVNDDGGSAQVSDWTLKVDTTVVVSGVENEFAVGTYTISESGGPSGYAVSFDPANTVTLQPGDDKTVTITNDDIRPKLTVIKEVVNDDGGSAQVSDWTLKVDTTVVVSGVENEFAVGTYTISESGGPSGYAVSFDPANTVTLQPGDDKTVTITNDDIRPKLTVIKEVVNDDGGSAQVSDWTLKVDTTVVVSGVENEFAVGTYTISESGGPSGYAVSFDPANTVTLQPGDDKTVTITNDDIRPKLTVIKEVVNDDGGSAQVSDWTLKVDTTVVVSGVENEFAVGTYTISESGGPSGYAVSFDPANTVTLQPGDDKTVTITNDDIRPKLTVIKEVVNDDGGSAQVSDWTLKVDTTVVVSGVENEFAVGTYTISESGGPSGYAVSFDPANTVTLQPGDDKTVTITNDDIRPKLTVIKEVVNDDGGSAQVSDWTLKVDTTVVVSGVENEFAVGTYTISESGGPSGYAVSFDPANTVTLQPGDDKTVTITNDDIRPKLTVIKEVVNDDGGSAQVSDWTLKVDTTVVVSGVENEFAVGTYTISESGGPSGYAVSFDPANTVTLQPGDDKTVTITNDDIRPKLTVIKEVVNDDGGSAQVSDWTLKVDTTVVVSGVENEFAVGTYTISESGGPSGYAVSFDPANTVTLQPGDDKTVTITNDDIRPKLTVIKEVVNDDGGSAQVSDWTLKVDTTVVVSGVENEFAVGTYTISESGGPSGYAVSFDPANTVTLQPGDDKTVTITNDDIRPKLTVIKEVVNDDGGSAQVSDWTLKVDTTVVVSGVENEFAVGTYTISESGGPSGYAVSFDPANTVTLQPGDDKTVTITNDDIRPKLTVIKEVVNDDGGSAQVSDWTLKVDTTVVVSGVENEFAVGTYTISESGGPSGYAVSFDPANTVTLQPGDDKTVTITNDDIRPKLTVIKEVVNDDGGSAQVSDWTLKVDTTVVVSGVENEFAVGTYTISESGGPSGYAVSFDPANTVTLQPGDDKTVTITNDDIRPKLTVIKEVVNDDGGSAQVSDWTLKVDTTVVVSGVENEFAVGTYTISESGGPSGYAVSFDPANTVTLQPGDDKTVTITNDDIRPKLTVIKEVVNDDGGSAQVSDWTLKVDTTVVVSGVENEFAVGTYTISESGGPSGYAVSFDPANTVTLQPGDDKTVTIINDDIAPNADITIRKLVSVDGGATWEEANEASGPSVRVGDTVLWRYVVTNAGNAILGNLIVTDDQPGVNPVRQAGGDINNNGQLDPGETWTYQASAAATLGQYKNIGTVIGSPEYSPDVTDSDPSYYLGVNLKIELDPEGATNKVGDEHVITAKVWVDTGSGFPTTPNAPDGTKVDFDLTGSANFVDATGAVIGKTTSETTTGGMVSVTLNSLTPGANTIEATATHKDHSNVTATTGTTGNGSNATKDYVNLKIELDPEGATNKVGDEHVITAKVWVDTGSGFPTTPNAPDGTKVDFDLTGSANFVDATGAVIGKTTSETTTGGMVSVTLNSLTPGANTIEATATHKDHSNVTATTGTTGNGSNATKDYVNLKIELDPEGATNKVGDEHVITAKVWVDTGSGFPTTPNAPDGTKVDFDLTGSANFVDATGAVIGKTTSETTTGGMVSVTLNSLTPGANTIEATATHKDHSNVTATTGTTGNGSNATKDYVNLKIELDPEGATNKVGDEHVITAKVWVDTGSGFPTTPNAPDGTKVDFDLTGSANFVDATGAVIGKTTSETTTGGMVSVTLNSLTPGANTIEATATHKDHSNVTATTGTMGNGSNATKDYVNLKIELDPEGATNKVGDEHVITAKVWVDTGSGFPTTPNAPDGTKVDFDLTGSANFVDATGAVIGKTTSETTTGGMVSVTLNSLTPGANTIEATATHKDHSNVTATTGTMGNGSNATKDYVNLKIELDPEGATNKVGDEHVITAKVWVDTGSGFPTTPNAPDGTKVDFDLTGSANFVDATGAVIGKTTSETTTGGMVSVTLNSLTPGANTIEATATHKDHSNVTATTGTMGNGSNATKDYVNLKIELDPEGATNKVGDEHVITAKVWVDTGSGFPTTPNAPDGTKVDFDLTGSANFVDATGAVIGKTTSETTTGGMVSVTLNSLTPGANTIEATATHKDHSNVTATTGTTGNGSNATKDYVNLKIELDPEGATNKVGDEHVITAKVWVDTGSGFPTTPNAPDGTKVDFDLTGSANFVDATGAVIGKTTSETTTGGMVSVTLNSLTPGANTIEATATHKDHSNVTATTGTTGNGSNATKDYVNLKIELDPEGATNKVGDEHVITAKVWVDTGSGFPTTPNAPDGTKVDFDLTGSANFVDATGAVIGKTTSETTTGGMVSVTLNSLTPGANTIEATATHKDHSNVTATTGTTGNGSNATKDYVTTGIRIEKKTNGQDADTGTGPYIAVGSTVTWSYTVTNLGNTPLSNVVVTDDNGTPSDPTDDAHPAFTGGDTNPANGSLDPAEVWMYQATGTAVAGQYENIATVTGIPPVGSDVSDNDHSHYFGSDPRISLVKTGTLHDDDGIAGVSAGDTISYAFTVTNTGNVTLSNVTVADKVGGVTVSGGPLASLGVGSSDSTTFTGSYTITQADIDAGTFTNTAEATGTPPSGPPVTGEDSDTQELTQSPAIDIEKATNGQDADTAPGPSLAVGELITWTYIVTNTGNVTLTNITVTDSDLGAVGTITSLVPGAFQTLTKTGTAVAGQYANTGTATVIFGDTTYTDSDDSHYFGAGADLSLTKSVDNPTPNEGDTIVYTITLTNGGPSDATGVQVTDALPAGLTYVSDSGAGAYSSATNVWMVSNLTNGASVTLAITATVDTGTAGTTIANTAEVTAADQPDPDSTPNNHDPDEDDQSSVSITVQSADLVVDKTVDNPTPNEGDTIVYTISITNDGPSDATGVTLGDLLPVGVTYVSDNGGGAYDSATGVWTVGSIAVGDTAVLEITATVDAGTAGTTITNTAEVTTSDQPDPDDTNNRDSADITVPEEVAGGGGAAVECEGVIINEVAWAGTAADSRDEWIELRNLGTIPVDLTGWTLRWRRKQPTTEEEYRWKVVDLSGILLPASTSACELADNDYTSSVEFIKRDTDDLSWWILGKQEEKDGSYYTIERRHDETISNEEADLLYDTTEPYEMELTDLGDVIQLRNDLGEVVDTANANNPERDGWPAGSAATFATMERTDPLGPDTWENWHTNLGIITRGLDAQGQPLIATADALNSKELEELALNAELPPTKTRAGARLEVGLDLPREDRKTLGWPWIRVTQPDLAEAAGGGGAVEAGAGFSFSGRYSGDLYWLGIDTGGLSPGQYNIWVVYGEGKAVLVPIVVLP